jgi:hypothetical protein
MRANANVPPGVGTAAMIMRASRRKDAMRCVSALCLFPCLRVFPGDCARLRVGACVRCVSASGRVWSWSRESNVRTKTNYNRFLYAQNTSFWYSLKYEYFEHYMRLPVDRFTHAPRTEACCVVCGSRRPTRVLLAHMCGMAMAHRAWPWGGTDPRRARDHAHGASPRSTVRRPPVRGRAGGGADCRAVLVCDIYIYIIT